MTRTQDLGGDEYHTALTAHIRDKDALEVAVRQEASQEMVVNVRVGNSGQLLPLHVHPSCNVRAVTEVGQFQMKISIGTMDRHCTER